MGGVVKLMNIFTVWLINIGFFPFLQDYGLHRYVGHKLSVVQYSFTFLSKHSWHGSAMCLS
jgi:hypothetical protein